MVLTVSVLVAVSPSVTAPLAVTAVMSALPLTESTPALVKIVELPRATAPPPLKPGAGVDGNGTIRQLAVFYGARQSGGIAALGKNGIRGGRGLLPGTQRGELLLPLVSTAICSQLLWPFHTLPPKSIVTVNRPLVTATALLVTGPATAVPPALLV